MRIHQQKNFITRVFRTTYHSSTCDNNKNQLIIQFFYFLTNKTLLSN